MSQLAASGLATSNRILGASRTVSRFFEPAQPPSSAYRFTPGCFGHLPTWQPLNLFVGAGPMHSNNRRAILAVEKGTPGERPLRRRVQGLASVAEDGAPDVQNPNRSRSGRCP